MLRYKGFSVGRGWEPQGQAGCDGGVQALDVGSTTMVEAKIYGEKRYTGSRESCGRRR